jgi:hypothetical protein
MRWRPVFSGLPLGGGKRVVVKVSPSFPQRPGSIGWLPSQEKVDAVFPWGECSPLRCPLVDEKHASAMLGERILWRDDTGHGARAARGQGAHFDVDTAFIRAHVNVELLSGIPGTGVADRVGAEFGHDQLYPVHDFVGSTGLGAEAEHPGDESAGGRHTVRNSGERREGNRHRAAS